MGGVWEGMGEKGRGGVVSGVGIRICFMGSGGVGRGGVGVGMGVGLGWGLRLGEVWGEVVVPLTKKVSEIYGHSWAVSWAFLGKNASGKTG